MATDHPDRPKDPEAYLSVWGVPPRDEAGVELVEERRGGEIELAAPIPASRLTLKSVKAEVEKVALELAELKRLYRGLESRIVPSPGPAPGSVEREASGGESAPASDEGRDEGEPMSAPSILPVESNAKHSFPARGQRTLPGLNVSLPLLRLGLVTLVALILGIIGTVEFAALAARGVPIIPTPSRVGALAPSVLDGAFGFGLFVLTLGLGIALVGRPRTRRWGRRPDRSDR